MNLPCVHHEMVHTPDCDCGECSTGLVLAVCVFCGRRRPLPVSVDTYFNNAYSWQECAPVVGRARFLGERLREEEMAS